MDEHDPVKRPGRSGPITRLFWLMLVCGCGVAHSAPAGQPQDVLGRFSNNRLVPGNIEIERGLRAVFSKSPDRNIELFSEFMDNPAFSGEAFDQTMATYLRGKYISHPPRVIIATGTAALAFLLHHRAELFAGVPVVFAAVEESFLQSIPQLPADVVGVPLGTLTVTNNSNGGTTFEVTWPQRHQ
jgi:hypothetical protein